MKNVLLQSAMKLNKNRKLRKGWQMVVRTLATGVVFCTTYALILPAITIQADPVCGFEEHVHTDSCYQQSASVSLGCTPAAEAIVVHKHNELCLNDAGELICTLPEISVHTHEEGCYSQADELACSVTHVHSEACVQTQQQLVCTLPEEAAHAHNESCTFTQSVLICTDETHVHGEECYEAQTTVCELAETEGHTHGESCYAVTEVPCTEPTAEEHIHGEACYQQVNQLTCTMQELQLHTHEDACYDAEGTLLCTLPVVVEHIHDDSCLVTSEQTEPVLICELQEHVHVPECYPVEEEPIVGTEYFCGYSIHAHNENCYALDGTLTCTIPAHEHEAACVVKDLDLTADVEVASRWEAQLAELDYTGVWSEDILTVAKSQLGYQESEKNCILEDGKLQGYTRYADWYGEYYGDWDDMFVSFCLHYAQIPEDSVPYDSDTAHWIEVLTEKGLFAVSGEYTPAAGDLIFWDSDADGVADKSGIVEEITFLKEIKIIAGDTEENRVDTVSLAADSHKIAGYGKLPMNPIDEEQWNQAEAVSTMLAELPEAETVKAKLRELNDAGDKAGYDALRQEVVSRMEAAEAAYNALNETQQARVTGLERLEALKEICGGENWQQFAALTDDSAVVIQLTADGAEIIRTEKPAEEPADDTVDETAEAVPAPVIPENAVLNQDIIRYSFTATTESYYTDISYGEATVKLEFVLPLPQDKAVFDTASMPWLENSTLNTETRLINETETTCQVLTGYKKLVANETSGIVVPGSFTETVSVKVANMTHGEKLAVIISAAMEHNTWDGICEAHQAEEKRTVATPTLTVHAPQSAEIQLLNYEAFLQEAQDIDDQELSDSEQYFAAIELMNRVADAYNAGGLSDAQYEELSVMITALCDVNMYAIAEPCIGTNWMKIDYDEEIVYGEESASLTTYSQASTVFTEAALSAETYANTFPSSQQIDREGSEAVSQENAVMVSKTIEGTDTENVFDITLQIVTKDEVNEVYKDPDMAVVVVMDISNTMRSDFGNTTRYKAAMAAGENFLKKFAEQNSTLSRVGYVAFNTSAHKIFDLSSCNTTAQANSLTSTMKTQTGNIINASDYADSRTRFTNMQAGLKMASNMLANANNQHKYIIFISDGFPTTYIKSGTTGYEPFSSSGTKDNNGVFYDDALNKWCLYGTSYSDTAAIKARELAVSLKKDGTNIFSIGVDVGGQTLWSYHNQSVNANGFSVVERREEASYYRTNGYEIGTDHDEIDKTSVTNAEKTAMAQDFKDWLKGSATSGIGSGYYYDSTDLSGLNAAYDQIFQKILELNASSSHLDWVASDPMPDMGVHEVEAMEFIAFWDLDENDNWVLVADNLTGESKDGNLYDNTADFHEDTQTIHWDVKKSGYISQTVNNSTTYLCELKYRVRLKNEESVFVENQIYDTNDVTTLTYRIIEVQGEQTSISEQREVDFPIPAVHGYLSELNFKKLQPTGNPLEGAEFTLSHDTATCNTCRGDGKNHVSIPDQVATSDRYGMVSFTRIPSGHIYTLTETVVPDGFIATTNTYQVSVSYDALTVTVTDADGNELEWNETIENDMYYALPETGGMGTSHFTFGGLLMIAASLVYICITGRKRQKGGR